MSAPLVLIPRDVKRACEYPFHPVGEKAIHAVAHGTDDMPILTPALVAGEELDTLADHCGLAPARTLEGRAEDGLVADVSLPGQRVLGVQRHPEWRVRNDPVSAVPFPAFGRAIRMSTER